VKANGGESTAASWLNAKAERSPSVLSWVLRDGIAAGSCDC